jgi:hypothetical protein
MTKVQAHRVEKMRVMESVMLKPWHAIVERVTHQPEPVEMTFFNGALQLLPETVESMIVQILS